MEYLLAGSLLGVGLLLNNNNNKDKIKNDNKKLIKDTPELYNNIYDFNNKKLMNKDKKVKQVRFEQAKQDKPNNNIFMNTNSINSIDTYNEKPISYLERPQHTRKNNEREDEIDSVSLTGEKMNTSDFTHNNMVPFFGSRVKQNMDIHANDNILETFTGVRTYDIKKEEIAPLFKPTENITNIHGSKVPENRDRYIESKYTPFVHPIKSVKVGPGLDEGFSSKPTGGYQNRKTTEYAKPKTTDELTALNNPKLSYKGTIIPGKKISKPAMMGKMEKRVPDKFYVNTPDRYNTTVGAQTKPKIHPKISLEATNRQETSKEYSGIAGPSERVKPSKRGKYQKSKNNILSNFGYRNASDTGKWDNKYDYGKSGVIIPSTERQTTQHRTHASNVISIVKSIIAPIQDIIKPSKKENAIGNLRQAGNVTMPIPTKQTVYDPDDVARTTIKETNIHDNRTGNINGHNKMTIYDPDDIARTTIKETNIHDNRSGYVHGPSKLTIYDPDDVARTTIKETNIHDNRSGNMNGPRRLTIHDPDDTARTTIKETNIHDNRSGNMNGPKMSTVYDPDDTTRTTIKETNINDNRLGNLKSVKEDGYAELPGATKVTIRNTLDNVDFHANLKGETNNTIYDPNDVTRTTIKETNIHNDRTGNMGNTEKNDGYRVADVTAPFTNRQFTSDIEYIGDANKTDGDAYLVTDVQVPDTNKQFTSDIEYTGAADSVYEKGMSYADIYNATLNDLKEGISQGREPTQTGVKIPLGEDSVCMTTNKEQYDNVDPEMTRIVQLPPDKLQFQNMTTEKGLQTIENEILSDRNNPSMLEAFKKNPLTQPLDSHSFP